MLLRIFVLASLLALAGAGCAAKGTIRVKKTRESADLPRGRKIRYEGGTGESREQAVVIIGAEDLKEGVAAEYDFISHNHGKKDKAWRVKSQTQIREGTNVYDMIEMEIISSGVTHYMYFDITNCSWKPRRE